MNVSIFDFASGISWTDTHKIYFKPREDVPNAYILTEYLDDVPLEEIENDIKTLSDLARSGNE